MTKTVLCSVQCSNVSKQFKTSTNAKHQARLWANNKLFHTDESVKTKQQGMTMQIMPKQRYECNQN